MIGKTFLKFALAFSTIIAVSIISLAVTGYLNEKSDGVQATVVENN